MDTVKIRAPLPLKAVLGRHFNMWISIGNSGAPIFAVQLVAMCAGTGLNWALLACVAHVKTGGFKDKAKLEGWDWFGTGGAKIKTSETLMAMLNQAVEVAATCDTLAEFPGLSFEEHEKVLNAYETFLRWASAYTQEPLPPPAGPPAPPAPKPAPVPPKPEIKPEPKPQPPAPVPVPPAKPEEPPKSDWLRKLGRVVKWAISAVAVLGTVLSYVGFLIPLPVRAGIEAALPFVKPVLSALCNVLPGCALP